jgi:hypothetical protein
MRKMTNCSACGRLFVRRHGLKKGASRKCPACLEKDKRELKELLAAADQLWRGWSNAGLL